MVTIDQYFDRFLLEMLRLKSIVEKGGLKLRQRQAQYLVDEGFIQRQDTGSAFYIATLTGKSFYDKALSFMRDKPNKNSQFEYWQPPNQNWRDLISYLTL